MIQLSDTQRLILSNAAQREERIALPLPTNLRGGAASKVIGALIAKGLLEEVDAKPGDPVWRKTGDGHGTMLVITDAGLAAIGTPKDTNAAPQSAAGGTTARAPRAGSKQAKLIVMLRAPEGATVAEIAAALGWLPHTVRGSMAGALKKKLGLAITSEKVEGRGRTYVIRN